MSKRLSVNDIKSIRRHRYILEKLTTLKLKKLRKILDSAPDELFKVIRLIFQQTVSHPRLNDRDIKALVQAKVGSFRQFLTATLPFIQKL